MKGGGKMDELDRLAEALQGAAEVVKVNETISKIDVKITFKKPAPSKAEEKDK